VIDPRVNESGAVAELEGAKAVAGIDNGGGGDCEEEDYGLRAVERGVEGGSVEVMGSSPIGSTI